MSGGPQSGETIEKLTLPGTEHALPAVSQFVMGVARRSRLDLPTSYRLRLAVDEIATNIVSYGYCRAGLSGPLILTAVWDRRQLCLYLEDAGLYYDPRYEPPPKSVHAPAEKREVGGLGIYLALCSVDDFEYERVGDLNRSTFTVRLVSD